MTIANQANFYSQVWNRYRSQWVYAVRIFTRQELHAPIHASVCTDFKNGQREDFEHTDIYLPCVSIW